MADLLNLFAFILWILMQCYYRAHGIKQFLTYSTKSCPENKNEWIKRSVVLNCSKENGYMCLPNQHFTELVEFCYIYSRITIRKDVCLFRNPSTLILKEYDCRNFTDGCPNTTYFSSELYKYPRCASIRNGCFLAEPLCTSGNSTYKSSIIPTTLKNIENLDGIKETNNISTDNRSLWILIGPYQGIFTIILIAINILYFSYRIKRYICRQRQIGKHLTLITFFMFEHLKKNYLTASKHYRYITFKKIIATN